MGHGIEMQSKFEKGDRVIAIGPKMSSICGRKGTIIGFPRKNFSALAVCFDGDSKNTKHNVHYSYLIKCELIFTTA